MSKWEIGRLLKVELVLQLAAFLVVFLNIPFLRQTIGFIYLSFLPGFLILKVVKPNKINWMETVFFSVGLSIAFLMLLGLLLNEICPVLGILSPLSAFPIVVSVFAVTMVLYLITYRRSTDFLGSTRAILKSHASALLLFSIFAITIIGTILGSLFGNSLVLLFLVIVVSALVLCSFSKKLIPSQLHPLVIFVISFFLLFHVSLISKYLVGYDINLEMYFAKLTYNASFWDKTIPHTYNSMLSVAILPVIYSNFLGLDLNWVFKAVYPLVYAIVPLVLYLAYRKLTSSRIAFLSVFFFMSMNTFYTTMLGLAREMIAELFFALLILLIVEEKISLPKRKLLFVIFGAALIVSHYTLSYIFMFYILLTFCLLPLLKHSDVKPGKVVTCNLVLLYFLMAFSWYIFVSPAAFKAITDTGSHIYDSILAYTAGPGVSGLMPHYISPIHEISKYLFYILQFFIIVGLIRSIVKYRETKFNQEYFSMSLISMLILMACIFIPLFASGLNVSRFYHITLFFLAPFSVLGGITIFSLLADGKYRLFTSAGDLNAKSKEARLFLVSLLLVFFFLFQVGFVYEVTGDIPSSLSLSLNRMQANPLATPDLWSAYNPEQDVFSATWLSEHAGNRSIEIYADRLSRLQVLTSYCMIPVAYSHIPQIYNYEHMLLETGNKLGKGAYIYLRQLNVVYGIMEGPAPMKFWNTTNISSVLDSCNKIYSNGDSDIYMAP